MLENFFYFLLLDVRKVNELLNMIDSSQNILFTGNHGPCNTLTTYSPYLDDFSAIYPNNMRSSTSFSDYYERFELFIIQAVYISQSLVQSSKVTIEMLYGLKQIFFIYTTDSEKKSYLIYLMKYHTNTIWQQSNSTSNQHVCYHTRLNP